VLAAIHFEISLGDADPWGASSRPALLAFVAFLAAFLFIRTSARLMRSPKVPWWPGSVTTGDLHIHHLVWGIVLMLVAGFISLNPVDSPWREIMAVLFGIGAGLTLDEFALWLRLDDVYWGPEGRRSVDAVLLAVVIGVLMLMGFSPFDQDASGGQLVGAVLVAINILITLVAILKGRTALGVVGLLVPLVSVVTAMRLARPGSPWAHRFYPQGSRRRLRSERRFPAGRQNRWDPLVDLFAGPKR
jgi:hypothetical protein